MNKLFFFISLIFLTSCVTPKKKTAQMALKPHDSFAQVVLSGEEKNVWKINVAIQAEIDGAGVLTIGENDSTAFKTFDVKSGKNNIDYSGDWYSTFCYVSFKPTQATAGKLKIEAEFIGD
jgi:hypothetical protein